MIHASSGIAQKKIAFLLCVAATEIILERLLCMQGGSLAFGFGGNPQKPSAMRGSIATPLGQSMREMNTKRQFWWFRAVLALMLMTSMCMGALADEAAKTPAQDTLVMEVYVRDGCPHCANAKAFLPAFLRAHPGLQVIYRPVDRDPSARAALEQHSRRVGAWPPGVPTFVIGEHVRVGFDSVEQTEVMLSSLLVQAAGNTPAGSAENEIDSRLFGKLSVSRLSLPLFTLALGLLDGFNPCAVWVLLFLLSMLIHLQDRLRMAWIAGVFLMASAAIYYAFMAAWLNLFLMVGLSSVVRVALAVAALLMAAIHVKDFIAFGKGISLSIPEAAKPGLYARVREVIRAPSLLPALAAVSVLAVVVNFIEALCTAGLPALYTAVLAQQNLSTAAHYAYLGLYIAAYMADDTVMVVIAVMALNSHKLTEQSGRWLKLLSGTVMLILGLVMLLKPEWL